MANDTTPISFATVYLPKLQMGSITDRYGRFAIDSLPTGTYAVEFSSLGYVTCYDTLDYRGQSERRDVTLPELAIHLREVVISNAEDPAYAILRKVQAADGLYASRVAVYDAEQTIDYTQNIKDLPTAVRRTVKTIMFLTPMRKPFNLIFDHPELSFTLGQHIHYVNKKIKSDPYVVKINENLTADEQKTLTKLATPFDAVGWTDSENRPWGADQMKKWNFELAGSYEEGGHWIDVITFVRKGDDSQLKRAGTVHIIEDLWRVLKFEYAMSSMQGKVECREVAPEIYLPVTSFSDFSTTVPADSTSDGKTLNFSMKTGMSIHYRQIQTK